MSFAHNLRMNSADNRVMGLQDEEIQEELLNADLKARGIDEEDINVMSIQEKQQLLAAMRQSCPQPQVQNNTKQQNRQTPSKNNAEVLQKRSNATVENSDVIIALDNTDEYPSLPTPSNNVKRGAPVRQQPLSEQKQPMKKEEVDVIIASIPAKEAAKSEEESGEDEDEDEDEDDDACSSDSDSFGVLGVDDNGANLSDHKRKKATFRQVQYYKTDGQSSHTAVSSMLKHYNTWYKLWCAEEKCNIRSSENDTNIKNNVAGMLSVDNQRHISSLLIENTDKCTMSSDETLYSKIGTPQKESSPDIEEIDLTGATSVANTTLTPNTKAKTLPRETRKQPAPTPNSSSAPAIVLDVDKKWDPDSGGWTVKSSSKHSMPGPSYSPEKAPMHNKHRHSDSASKPRTDIRKPDIDNQKKKMLTEDADSHSELKVQCPICQLDFTQSKIEGHAAICQSFPIETRTIGRSATTSMAKFEENRKSDSVNCIDESSESNTNLKMSNKKRATDTEDRKNTKRACLNRL